tara:strand:- start:453 stop:1190 length:738 start_codon:yes stop_codon:yes gene_type:complete
MKGLNYRKSVGWLSTGNGEGSLGLLKKGIELVNNESIDIKYVFLNREIGEKKGSDEYINYAKNNNVPVISYSSQKYKKRKGSEWKDLRINYDKEVLNKISNYQVDFIVAAGYMLFSPEICKHHKIINIHPALPDGPDGTWKNVILELIKSNSSYSGVSIHIMTPELDSGPTLSFVKFPIKNKGLLRYWDEIENIDDQIINSNLFKKIREIIIINERLLLKETLHMLSTNQLQIENPVETDLSRNI